MLEAKQNVAAFKHLQNPSDKNLQYNRQLFSNILPEIQFSNDWF